MKRKIISIAVALMATASVGVTASADYYLTANKNGSDVKVEVIADGATLPAMQFTVAFPSGVTAKNATTPSGAYYNSENGVYAWASTDAPADGTVMFSAEFTATDGDFTVDPAMGFSADLSAILKATIADGTVTVVEIPKPSEDTTSDTSTPSEGTSTPSEDTSTPSEGTSTPSGDTSTPSEGTSTPSGDTSTPSGDTSKPTGDTTSSGSGASSNPPSTGNTDNESGENPPTGVTGGVTAIAVAGIASFVAIKSRKQK